MVCTWILLSYTWISSCPSNIYLEGYLSLFSCVCRFVNDQCGSTLGFSIMFHLVICAVLKTPQSSSLWVFSKFEVGKHQYFLLPPCCIGFYYLGYFPFHLKCRFCLSISHTKNKNHKQAKSFRDINRNYNVSMNKVGKKCFDSIESSYPWIWDMSPCNDHGIYHPMVTWNGTPMVNKGWFSILNIEFKTLWTCSISPHKESGIWPSVVNVSL